MQSKVIMAIPPLYYGRGLVQQWTSKADDNSKIVGAVLTYLHVNQSYFIILVLVLCAR